MKSVDSRSENCVVEVIIMFYLVIVMVCVNLTFSLHGIWATPI
jgi:hypothetical protein